MPKTQKGKAKEKIKQKSKVRNSKATWSDTSSSKDSKKQFDHKVRITFIAIHDKQANTSSNGSNNGGMSSYDSDPISEVRDLAFDKLYGFIKMISRSLC